MLGAEIRFPLQRTGGSNNRSSFLLPSRGGVDDSFDGSGEDLRHAKFWRSGGENFGQLFYNYFYPLDGLRGRCDARAQFVADVERGEVRILFAVYRYDCRARIDLLS